MDEDTIQPGVIEGEDDTPEIDTPETETETETEAGETDTETDDDGDSLEESEETETEEKEEEKEETEEEEEEEEEIDTTSLSAKKLKAKYPTIFKDFPQLRAAIYQNREYEGLFGSPKEAKESAVKAESLDVIDREMSQGNASFLVENLNDASLEKFVDNIIPALKAKDPDLVVRATKPVFVKALARMIEEAGDDKNLKAAARLVHKHFFGSYDPKVEAPVNDRGLVEARKKLDDERRALVEGQYNSFIGEAENLVVKEMTKAITKEIDPKGKLDSFTRDALVQRIAKEVDAKVAKDEKFQTNRGLLIKRAMKDNFSRNHIPSLVAAYLGRAKPLIGSVRGVVKSKSQTQTKTPIAKTQIPQSPSSMSGRKVVKDDKSKSYEDILADR